MVITGRIFDIVIVNEKVAQIVLKKKDKDKVIPVAISVIGYWKDKALKEMKLKPKDKIKGNLYLKSSLWKGRYYTDAFFREIYLVEKSLPSMGNKADGMFVNTEDGMVDTETGEIINP